MIAAFAWMAVTVITLGWVHLTRQTKVSRSLRNSLVIAGRLFAVHVLTYAVLCAWLGIWAQVMLIIAAVVLLLAPLATLNGIIGDDVLGVAIAMTVLVPVYALKQFILGFPDRDEVILTPPKDALILTDLSRLNEATGTVVSTLKPFGKVEIEGAVYSATTADSLLIDQGATVRICEVRNTTVVVRAINPAPDV